MMVCPICEEFITKSEVLSEEIYDDCAILKIRYTCKHCHKDFFGTNKGEIKSWNPEEIEECDYYIG